MGWLCTIKKWYGTREPVHQAPCKSNSLNTARPAFDLLEVYTAVLSFHTASNTYCPELQLSNSARAGEAPPILQ